MAHDPGELDLCVMHDIMEIDGSTEDSPRYKRVYAIGWPEELDAGIWGGVVSDWFDTEEEALAWFDANYDSVASDLYE